MKHIRSFPYMAVLFATVFSLMVLAQPAVAASKMPSFVLQDAATGENVDSKVFSGKALLITFFATWCPPCIQEIPALIALQDSFKSKGFSVIAFSVDEGDLAPLEKLITKFGINYPVLLADSVVTRSFGGVTGIPATFLVNGQGQIVKK
ncbi:MAG: TlpA family protein disulfide reductase, partial [Desulfocapsa sp.]|nr:TlpA family protein disulfide reductase [Desulfocapsa sp.]